MDFPILYSVVLKEFIGRHLVCPNIVNLVSHMCPLQRPNMYMYSL